MSINFDIGLGAFLENPLIVFLYSRKGKMKNVFFFILLFCGLHVFAFHGRTDAGEKETFRILFFSGTGQEKKTEKSVEESSPMIRQAFLETLGLLLAEETAGRERSLLLQEAKGLRKETDLRFEDLILVSTPASLKAVLAEKTGGVPVVALEQNLLPELFSPGEMDFDSPLLLSSNAFWQERFFVFHKLVGFRRPGLVLPAPDSPDSDISISGALIRAGEKWQASTGQDFFSYGELADSSPGQCREAVDDLFFDGIDAMVLDGNPCFDPARSDFDELMLLLHQRGILPLSLADPRFSGRGILLGVTEKDLERRGRALGVEAFKNFLMKGGKGKNERERPAPEIIPWRGDTQAAFFLDLNVARKMGFDPSATLLGLADILAEE